MGIFIRQICLVAQELAPVVAALKHVFALNTAYIDDEVAHFGLENTLLGVGTQFIEVVAPIQDGTAAGRYLQRQGGDGGYMVIGQVLTQIEQAACRARAAARDVRVAFERNQPHWKLMQLHPRDMQAAFFEVDWEAAADPTGHWSPAGGMAWHDTISNTAVHAITAVTLEAPNPLELATLWADIAGQAVHSARSTHHVDLENLRLHFVGHTPARSPRLSGVTLHVSDRVGIMERARGLGLEQADGAIEIGGVWFSLEG